MTSWQRLSETIRRSIRYKLLVLALFPILLALISAAVAVNLAKSIIKPLGPGAGNPYRTGPSRDRSEHLCEPQLSADDSTLAEQLRAIGSHNHRH